MHDDQGRRRVHPAATEPPTTFTTSVAPTPLGGWLTVVDLGEGVTLSKRFDREEEALGYGEELAGWLRGHTGQ